MDKYIPISSFDAIYLVDLCEPLLKVARKRFAAKGWFNVNVLCQDASQFTLPEWADGKDPKGSISFVTMSYSLSMASHLTSRLASVFIQPRFQAIIRCWIESTTYSLRNTGCWL